MDGLELRALMTPAGLRLVDEVGPITTTDAAARAVTRLRAAGHDPALVAAVVTQARLRTRAEAKFGPFAASMLFTEAGLEQATRLRVAALHAGRFRAAGLRRVADLGCGIGADAMALASLDIEVTAVERDEVTAAVAAYNLAAWANAEVVHGDAERQDLAGVEAVWYDPARRDGVTRFADARDWSPSLDTVFATPLPWGAKLGPGIDRDLIPDDVEAQWVSVDGDVVEVALYSGPLAREGVRRAALVLRDDGVHELVAPGDSADVDAGPLGEYLLEPDGAVIRARLIGDLARSIGGRMLHPTIAYITADEPISTPFATTFRVLDQLSLDQRALKRWVREHDVGTLEIKKRGVDVDPAALRKALAPRGSTSATLLLTRVGERRRALVVERV